MPITSEIMKKTLTTLATLTLATLSILPGDAVNASSRRQCGGASYYGHKDSYAWKTTASGESMNPGLMTTAHRSLPFGTRVLVTNKNTRESVVVKVNDRGPFVAGRVLDLSYGAFIKIAPASQGVVEVCYSTI
jgi:rare lipoprotein A